MIHWTPEERERQARAAKAMIEMVQGPDRHSRIEARFERFVEANLKSGCDSVAYWDDYPALWEMAEAAESFLDSKRAEAKDGQ